MTVIKTLNVEQPVSGEGTYVFECVRELLDCGIGLATMGSAIKLTLS